MVNGNSSNSTVFEDIDSDGNQALHISYPLSEKQCCGQYGWISTTGPYTYNNPSDDANLGQPAPWNFPLAVYIEYTYKDSATDINGHPNEVGFWTFSASSYGNGDCRYIELDFNDTIGILGYATDGYHLWGCGNNGGTNFGYNFDLTNYTTYGYLITNDGDNNVSSCAYINGTRINCLNFTTQDSQGAIYGRMPLWFDGYWNKPPYIGPEDTWIRYIKVYTCANWQTQNNPAVSSRSGSTNNGNFWVP